MVRSLTIVAGSERSLRWVDELATFLLESLILAQDERWRRA
jgi:hypothetical protein